MASYLHFITEVVGVRLNTACGLPLLSYFEGTYVPRNTTCPRCRTTTVFKTEEMAIELGEIPEYIYITQRSDELRERARNAVRKG